MALYAAKIKVRGKVQDVSFRSFAKRNADMLGLKGYVNNMPNGGVEVVVEGNKDHIETLIEALRLGPENAVVKSVDIEWNSNSGMFTDFKIIY